MKILETDRLLLRTWTTEDLDPFAKMNRDPRVMEFFPSTQTYKQTAETMKRFRQHFDDHGYSLYPVIIKATNEFIGFTGLLTVDFKAHFTPAVEIGWRLFQPHWGKGYAPEAARSVLALAFNQLKLSEIVSFATKDNARSRRVMEKIDMSYNIADDFEHPKLPEGSPLRHHVLYRKQKTHWNNND